MNKRICPGCESAMQIYFARGVEVDRCCFCGGVWFDGGELERAAGREVRVEAAPGVTRRRCPSCRTTLSPASTHGLQVEQCTSCLSVYLDDGELARVAKAEVPLRPPQVQSGDELTFKCPGCGEVKPLDEGAATLRGMSCGLCFGAMNDRPAVLEGKPGPVIRRGSYTHRWDHEAYAVETVAGVFYWLLG